MKLRTFASWEIVKSFTASVTALAVKVATTLAPPFIIARNSHRSRSFTIATYVKGKKRRIIGDEWMTWCCATYSGIRDISSNRDCIDHTRGPKSWADRDTFHWQNKWQKRFRIRCIRKVYNQDDHKSSADTCHIEHHRSPACRGICPYLYRTLPVLLLEDRSYSLSSKSQNWKLFNHLTWRLTNNLQEHVGYLKNPCSQRSHDLPPKLWSHWHWPDSISQRCDDDPGASHSQANNYFIDYYQS